MLTHNIAIRSYLSDSPALAAEKFYVNGTANEDLAPPAGAFLRPPFPSFLPPPSGVQSLDVRYLPSRAQARCVAEVKEDVAERPKEEAEGF